MERIMPKAQMTAWTPSMSDEAVKAKTGRGWMVWFVILNKANATEMKHQDVANLLYEKYGCPGWWAQMITVEYERARGGRQKNQTADGYSVGVSKTLPVGLAEAYRAFGDAKMRAKWFPKGAVEPGKCTPGKYWRAKWNGGPRLEVGFYAKPGGKAQVALQVNKMAKKTDVERERAAWKKAFEKLETVLA